MTKANKINAALCAAFFVGLLFVVSQKETVSNCRTFDRMPVETREYVYELMKPTNIDTTTNTGKSMLVEFWKDNLPQVTDWELDNGICL